MASNWWYCFSFVTLLTAKGCVNTEIHQRLATDVVYARCPRCSTYGSDGYSISRLDFIKADILRKLNMIKPPNVTSSRSLLQQLPSVVPGLRNMVNAANDEICSQISDDGESITNKSIIAISQKADDDVELPDVVQFKLYSNPSFVKNASLNFYIRPITANRSASAARDIIDSDVTTESSVVRNVVVHVNKVYLSGANRQRRFAFYRRIRIPFTMNSRLQELDPGRWVSLEVTSLFRDSQFRQLRDQTLTILLQLVVIQNNSQFDSVATPTFQVDQSLKPYMEVKMRKPNDASQQQAARKRRQPHGGAGDSDCDQMSVNGRRCCRHKLTVNFAEFGWDWIVAPTNFEAYFCDGVCPFLYNQKDSVSHLVHQSRPQQQNSVCCAPSKFSPLPLVYVDQTGGVIYGTVPDMIIEQCRCM